MIKKIIKAITVVAGYVLIIDTARVVYHTGFSGFKEYIIRSIRAGEEYAGTI